MAQAPETVGHIYGCPVCKRDQMTLSESFEHSHRFHPWTVTTIRFRPEEFVAVAVRAKAYHSPLREQVVMGHALALGRMPHMEAPKRPRKTGEITLMVQPTDVEAVTAIVADLETLEAGR